MESVNNNVLNKNERLDDLGLNGLFLIQNPKQFCFGIDAVLLSDFAKVHKNETVVDLCSGNGIIPVLLAGKTKANKIFGIEIQKAPYDLAKRSITYNNLSKRVFMINIDIKDADSVLEGESAEVVTVNPPYMKSNTGGASESYSIKIARHEELCTLEDVIKVAYKLLKSKGRFYIVHRPLRLVEILKTMSENKIEPKSMRLVYPYIDREPNLVLIEGIKDANAELRIGKPLIVYESLNEYTEEVMNIYGHKK